MLMCGTFNLCCLSLSSCLYVVLIAWEGRLSGICS